MELEVVRRLLVFTNSWLLYAAICWVSSFFIITAAIKLVNPRRESRRRRLQLPPGPFPLPLIGNVFSLGFQLHKSLANLAYKYGPVLSLQLGFQTLVVVSSAQVAKEVLHTKDVSFANRFVPDALTAHQEFSISLRPADARWKMYRRICTTHIFANSKLDATKVLRKRKIQELLLHVQNSCGKPLNIGEAVFATSLNFLSNTIFSIDLADSNSSIAREFRELTTLLAVESGKPNLADFYPVLKALDPQGLRKRTTAALDKIINLFDTIIIQRLQAKKYSSSATTNNMEDVLSTLLSLTQLEDTTSNKELQLQLQLTDIQHLLVDLFAAGTDTTTSTIEWAMAELLHNPEKMKITQNELKEIIGNGNILEEEHIAQLPYLQAVLKETVRMHPPVPLLIPRKVFEDTELSGFLVPKNAQVVINVYAIGRDPTLWTNPDLFQPERFLRSSIDFKGHNFEFIPFGSGRRICPGLPLANRMITLVLGSLIHSFNWKLQTGLTPQTLNMEDKFGLTLHKAQPLYLIPLPP